MTNHNNNSTTPTQTNQTRGPVQQLRQWNVVLINDQEHSYNYVTTMLRELFALPVEKAVEVATAVDRSGRAVCMTTHREYAEYKRDQIMAFGKDALVDRCSGSMTAVIEPRD
jgi:ATP-dependent Clp protease adaptor protein ClpS